MEAERPSRIIVAGAGIAGLTAALAFAARGFSVQVFERSPELGEIGAGLQLSPNATRILDRLGVLAGLERLAVRPPAIVLRNAKDLRELARVPLGASAERRWGAPYLVVHRADLQKALLATVARTEKISLITNTVVEDFQPSESSGVVIKIRTGGVERRLGGMLLVGADGVWSKLRNRVLPGVAARSVRLVAWRRTIPADNPLIRNLFPDLTVNAFLHPGFHLVAYPLRGGSEFNFVAFTQGQVLGEDWSGKPDPAPLRDMLRRSATPLAALAEDADAWTAWPIHTVDSAKPWIQHGNFALIGDAAHAMTPFAAQGAAMAIEDAWTLAAAFSSSPSTDLAKSLATWEQARRLRIQKVARRGAFNRFVWHAAGPAAWGRNLVLASRSPESLAADMDWLYGEDINSP
ncbi:FAD-dependent monooxygenase [Mesorhizobium sp. IMUNJ 23232]|uniref:FAD-dependent monooxygenase n=1 Tax=Mesorhizobium sp. IMUNJ 23232 TaxID=3376064 RepID=UPI0037B0BA5A